MVGRRTEGGIPHIQAQTWEGLGYGADQTRLFSRKRWLTDRFCAADVLRHTRRTEVLSPR